VRRALAAMQENLETPLAIGAVAAQAGCSARRLSDAMRAALGAAPQVVYKRLRLNYARKLARETEFSVAEIAWRSGYENPSALTRAYRAEFGVTPRGERG
jgi:transcriptional regulator GlxA family with amidase domain